MKEKRDRYVSGYAENYEAERINTEQWKKEQDIVERFLKEVNPKTVLDIPVGTGRFFGKYKTTGIDVSLDMLEQAEKKSTNNDKLILGDIFNLKYRDEFDVVISMRFLNWITTEELEVVIKNLTRATKKYLILGIHLDVGQKGDVCFHKHEDIDRILAKNKLNIITKRLAREDDYYIYLLEKETFTVSYNIMAHRKRKKYVEELKKILPDVKVIWDTQNNIWHTRKKCLRDHIKQGCDFGITIQDDSLVCENFKEKAEDFIREIGDPFGVYNYFYPQRLKIEAIDEALTAGRNYVKSNQIMSEICFAFPTKLMQEMMDVCDDKVQIRVANLEDADWVMDFRYMPTKKLNVYFSLPSLIDHKCPEDSLYYTKESIKNTGADARKCWWFDGKEWSVQKTHKPREYEYYMKGGRNVYEGAFYKIVSDGQLTDNEIKDIISAAKSTGMQVRRISFYNNINYYAK